MNYKIFLIAAVAFTLSCLSSCRDADYIMKYEDPSKTNNVSCEKLMTGVFHAGDKFTFPDYWRLFTWDHGYIGRLAQTVGFMNSESSMYSTTDGYFNDRWDNFYQVLTQYRALEYTYNNLAELEKENNKLFLLLAKIYMFDHLEQIVDTWGDAPYAKAGFLSFTGDIKSSYPSYDGATSIYRTMIDELKEVNSALSGMSSLPSLGLLSSQDYINKGDLMKWRKYGNSLRLRMAMRVADQGELTELGRTAIKEMLADAATYPLVENNAETIEVHTDSDGFNFEDGIRNGFESWSGAMNTASQAMIDMLKEDPRMEVLYDTNASGEYVGLDTHDSYQTQSKNFEKPTAEKVYSAVDSATFSRNKHFPGVMLTAAEVAFNKAEAYQKNYASGDAKEAFVQGIVLSTEYLYGINAKGTFRKQLDAPAAEVVKAFAEKKWDEGAEKVALINTQQWVNFGFVQALQAWSNVRRTGYPELYFVTDETAPIVKNVPNRLIYPSTERTNNPDNYAAMKDKDQYDRKLFWAK